MDSLRAAGEELLATTRSVRKRIDFEQSIDRKLLLECIDLAVQAPTGVGDESWKFVIVTDQEKKQSLAELYRRAFDDYIAIRAAESDTAKSEDLSPNYRYLADRLQDFPALILVCREGRPPPEYSRQLAFYGSILPAAWSLMLALRTRGIGATWTTLLARYEREAAGVIGIPDDATITVMLPVGVAKSVVLKRAKRRAASSVCSWDSW